MKIATWNINGVRARLENLCRWLKEFHPDVVCLQEIKCVDDTFPRATIEDLGYHVETFGQKSFNGVAILAKKSPDEVHRGLPGNTEDHQARLIEAVFSVKQGVVRVSSLYLPNGNPIGSEKFTYKLAWMERLADFVQSRLQLEEPAVFAGDFNVIAAPIDAKNPDQWKNDALFQLQTRQAFFRLCHLGLSDALREVSDEPHYTFWDFQAGAWAKNNGIRIDHQLLTPQATDRLQRAYVQPELRGWERPSDHVPMWIELDFDF